MQRLITLLMALMLAACAATSPRPRVALPVLHLSPASLGHELAEQQALTFHFGRESRELTALLEVDADELRLAVEALGQTGVRLRWDSERLHETRATWLPPQVRGARVLDDIQFVLWPESAIRAALPPRWQLDADGEGRRLVLDGTVWLDARYASGAVTLDNTAENYRLSIRSATFDHDNGDAP